MPCISQIGRIDFRYVISLGLVLATFSNLQADAQKDLSRSAVEKEQVLEALAHAQMPVKGVEIIMAAPVFASVQNAELEIKSFESLGPRVVRLRLSCKNHGNCIPFYATAVWPDMVSAELDKAILGGSNVRGIYQRGRGPIDSAGKTQDARIGGGGPSVPPNLSVKSGSSATLIIEDGRVHIRLQVVCLQSGKSGDKVRVVAFDHKRTYVAEVLAPDVLRGSL